jgi:hypothetical protein
MPASHSATAGCTGSRHSFMKSATIGECALQQIVTVPVTLPVFENDPDKRRVIE